MHAFTDRAGRKWKIEINVTTVRRVRDQLEGVDLLDVNRGGLLERLAGDPILLADLLFVICEEQLEAAKITDEQFGAALAGDAIEAATTAFLEELVDFFHGPRKELLATAMVKLNNLERMGAERATAFLNSDEMDQEIEARLKKILTIHGNSSGSSPAVPESTPDHAHSEN